MSSERLTEPAEVHLNAAPAPEPEDQDDLRGALWRGKHIENVQQEGLLLLCVSLCTETSSVTQVKDKAHYYIKINNSLFCDLSELSLKLFKCIL